MWESWGALTLAKHPQNFGYNLNNKVIFLEFLPKIENYVLKWSLHCEQSFLLSSWVCSKREGSA